MQPIQWVGMEVDEELPAPKLRLALAILIRRHWLGGVRDTIQAIFSCQLFCEYVMPDIILENRKLRTDVG